jgi:hypothetical protein
MKLSYLGGAVVFVQGMRVLNLVEKPASRAAAQVPPTSDQALPPLASAIHDRIAEAGEQ